MAKFLLQESPFSGLLSNILRHEQESLFGMKSITSSASCICVISVCFHVGIKIGRQSAYQPLVKLILNSCGSSYEPYESGLRRVDFVRPWVP